MVARFISLADVAETLGVSSRQVASLIKSGELPALKVGKGWRVEVEELEKFIQRGYAQTQAQVASGVFDDVES